MEDTIDSVSVALTACRGDPGFCRVENLPFYLFRFFGWSNNQVDIRQINRRNM